jgi:hypothetical protein
MTDENKQSIPSRGSQVVAYAVIDDEGVQHSLWFLEKDATDEASLVGGTVVRLGSPSLTDEEREAIAYIALMHSRLKCDGHRPGRTKQQDLDTVWGFLEQTR